MKRTTNKNYLGAFVAATLALLTAAGMAGGNAPAFLKGKVHDLSGTDLSLDKKLAQAKEDFQRAKAGDFYFTGHIFQSRHQIHRETCRSLEGNTVAVGQGQIKISRKGHKEGLSVSAAGAEEKPEIAGVIFLHSLSGDQRVSDASLLDLDETYEFSDAPLYWLGDIATEESLRYVETAFKSASSSLRRSLIFIASCHSSPGVYDFLRQVASGNFEQKLRENAVFWLGNFKDLKSLQILREVYASEKAPDIRKQVVFALQLNGQKEAIEEIIRIAKNDQSSEVRKSAIFWLGQKATAESIKAIKDIVDDSEEEADLKKQAVFAISQLPREKSVPLLIDISKSSQSPAVRKSAIFWLGQVGDQEALKFFEEILLKK
jgi:HEAT repeat protein